MDRGGRMFHTDNEGNLIPSYPEPALPETDLTYRRREVIPDGFALVAKDEASDDVTDVSVDNIEKENPVDDDIGKANPIDGDNGPALATSDDDAPSYWRWMV